MQTNMSKTDGKLRSLSLAGTDNEARAVAREDVLDDSKAKTGTFS